MPLLSGIADASARGVIKLTKVHRLTLIAAGYLFALPFYLVLFVLEGAPQIHPIFWLAISFHIPLLLFANILTVEAHRSSPLILTAPYLSLTPAFLLITAPLMGGGNPTWLGVAGVLIITFGLYILNSQNEQDGWIQPFRNLARERGSRLMLAVALIFAFTANLDLIALKSSSAAFYLLVDHGFVGVLSLILILIYLWSGRASSEEASPKGSWPALMLYGVAAAASAIPQMLALRWIPVVPYVIASKRAGTIFFTVLLGFIFAFILKRPGFQNEKENLWHRVFGVLLMVIGMVVIILYGRV